MSNLEVLTQEILRYEREQGRDHLPWRRKGISAYEVWVSEIMLQQTQVNRVVEYFQRLIERFPDVKSLAASSWDDFLPYYLGLGYYRRGRNMLKTAQLVVEQHGGRFPRDKQALMALPGVGEYTASAILSFAYGEPYLALDTNLQRVLGRFLHGNKKAVLQRKEVEKAIRQSLSSPEDFRQLNAGVMDFAGEVCTNRKPRCLLCPLREACEYVTSGGALEFKPVRRRVVNVGEEKVDWKQARVILTLHREHQEYFSSNLDEYQPFTLPASVNTRAKIKQHFRERYGLELAVRPPHRKELVEGKPTLFINAQILQGEHVFGTFSANEKNEGIG